MMNTKLRALLWEELRTGGVIAGWCVVVGFLCMAFIGVPQYFEGSEKLYTGPTLAVSLGTVLMLVVLLLFRTGEFGSLKGGFSNRVLSMPVETSHAVGVILGFRGLLVFLASLASFSSCQLLVENRPLWILGLFMTGLYLCLQMLDWLRRPLPFLAGFGFLVFLLSITGLYLVVTNSMDTFKGSGPIEHLYYSMEDASTARGGAFPVSSPIASLLLLLVGTIAYLLSLVGVNLARRGERRQGWIRFRLPETLPFPGGLGENGFSSPRWALLWSFMRKDGAYLPLLASILSLIVALVLFVAYFQVSRDPASFSTIDLTILEWVPWPALLLGAFVWGGLRGGVGMERGVRPSLTEYLYPMSSSEMTATRLCGHGIALGATWFVALLISNAAFLTDNNGLAWRIYAASLAAGETSLREILSVQLALPLIVLFAAWTLMALRTRLVACFFGLLILLWSIAGASEGVIEVLHADISTFLVMLLVVVTFTILLLILRRRFPDHVSWRQAWWGVPCVLAVLLGNTGTEFFKQIFWLNIALVVTIPAGALAWAWTRGLVPQRHLFGCAFIGLLTTAVVYPFGAHGLDRTSLALAVAVGALVIFPYPALLLDLHRRRHGEDTYASSDEHARPTSWHFTSMGRVGGVGLMMAVVLSLVWFRWPAKPVHIEALRGHGAPATLSDLAASYGPLPKGENAASHYLDVMRHRQKDDKVFTAWIEEQKKGDSKGDRGEEKIYENFLDGAMEIEADHLIWTRVWEVAKKRYELVERGAEARLAEVAAAGFTQSHYPVSLGLGPSESLHSLSGIRGLARAQAFSIWVASVEDRPQDVVETLRAMGPLAASLREEPSLISQLVRMAIYRILVDAVEQGLSRTEFDDGQLASMQEFLFTALPPLGEHSMYRQALVGERVFVSSWDPLEEGLEQPYNRIFDSSTRAMATFSRIVLLRGLAEMERNYQTSEAPLLREIEATRNPRFVVANIALPALDRTAESEWRSRVLNAMAATACAIERYRLAHGGLPEALSDLVPMYIAAVPTDPFRDDSGPISYVSRDDGSFVVYSWGHNRTDEEGAESDSGGNWLGGDGTFSVASPAFRNGPQLTDTAPVAETKPGLRRSRNGGNNLGRSTPPPRAESQDSRSDAKPREDTGRPRGRNR
jgi:hypothetical protein